MNRLVLWAGEDGALVLACPHCDANIPVSSQPSRGYLWTCGSCRRGGVLL